MAQLKKRRPLFPAQTYREKRPENWRTDCYCAGRPAPVYGRGYLGMQDMLGKIDIVMGSFSKT
ncbi:MAG TPA: hypothetical protein VHM22_01975, partial [Bradyrhizobium sp.]|nr:hypothetical protein [Bradyrhizobium sp.]